MPNSLHCQNHIQALEISTPLLLPQKLWSLPLLSMSLSPLFRVAELCLMHVHSLAGTLQDRSRSYLVTLSTWLSSRRTTTSSTRTKRRSATISLSCWITVVPLVSLVSRLYTEVWQKRALGHSGCRVVDVQYLCRDPTTTAPLTPFARL